MEAVRMVVVTLALVLTATLMLAMVAHAGAWARRHRVDRLDLATARASDPAGWQRRS